MTAIDQLKIIDNSIKGNQAQYDLDRLAAKISAYSSGDLRKYEYLTGEDFGYKPSVVEQAKFDYSPLGKFFIKRLKEHKKDGLLKRLKNIEDKTEEQLEAFSKSNKISRLAKNKNDDNYNHKIAFYRFYRGFVKFLKMSLGSIYNDISEFSKLSCEFKIHSVITTETKELKKGL